MSTSRVVFLTVSFLLFGFAWAVGGHEVRDYAPYYVQRVTGQSVTVTVSGKVVYAEVAQSDRAKAKGLSGRRRLPVDHGMYFPFDAPSLLEFWMSGMRFPLDIVWLHNGTIVDISRNVLPPVGDEPPVRVRPEQPASAVLEVRTGVAQSWNIGDTVTVRDDRWFFR